MTTKEYLGSFHVWKSALWAGIFGSNSTDGGITTDRKNREKVSLADGPKKYIKSIMLAPKPFIGGTMKNFVEPVSSNQYWFWAKNPSYWYTLQGDWYRWLTRGLSISGDPLSVPTMPTAVVNAMISARLEAASKMNEPDINVPLFLAEITETLEMLVNPLGALRKFVRSTLKRSSRRLFDRGLHTAHMLSGSWLEYRYGWTPFLSDMDNIIQKSLQQKQVLRREIRKGSSKAMIPISTTTSSGDKQPISSLKLRWNFEKKVYWEVFSNAYYHYLVDTYNLDYGFRPSAIPALIWEKIPYSFVVDWFVNVGSYLGAHGDHPDIERLAFTSSSRYNEKGTWSFSHAFYWPGFWGNDIVYHPLPLNARGYHFSCYKRDVPVSVPDTLVLNWRLTSVKHAIDGIALSFQKFFGKRR